MCYCNKCPVCGLEFEYKGFNEHSISATIRCKNKECDSTLGISAFSSEVSVAEVPKERWVQKEKD